MLHRYPKHSLVVGQLQGELNVYIGATVTGFDEVLAVSIVSVDVEVQVFDKAGK